MRYFAMTVILTVMFVVNFTANPASANCHAKVEAFREKLEAVHNDNPQRQKLSRLIDRAEEVQNNKKKCGKILKKANKILTGVLNQDLAQKSRIGKSEVKFSQTENSAKSVAAPFGNAGGDFYFVDAHSQMDPDVDIERVISLMDHGGIYRTLLSNHMGRPWQDIRQYAEQHAGRILPAVRVKGRGFFGKKMGRYLKQLMPPIESGDFKAMAEVHLWHDSDGGKYTEVKYSFDHEIIQKTLKEAKRNDWPFIIHIEFNSLSESNYQAFMKGLGTFLRKNRDHSFVMIHMAQLEAGPVGELLAAHPNLHFMTSHATPSYQGGGKPFINMFEGESLKSEWKKLISRYPDRFIFALDNVFSFFWTPEKYLTKMDLWWKAMAELPAAQAHALAHGNAERLWKLAHKPADVEVLNPAQAKKILGEVSGYASTKRRRGSAKKR